MSISDVSSSAPRRNVIKSRDLARLRSFGPDTLIETDRGLLPAREIRRTDRLRTSGGEYAAIAWLDRLHLDAAFLRSVPELKPILISEGDLGFAPLRNVVLSPQQFVWDRRVGDGGDFRPAAEVTSHPRLFERRDVNVTYISIVCHAPVVIEAEGLWVSLVP